MTAFYERRVDVLVSHTNIVESGPGHSHRQHLDRAARRHVRPVAAVTSCAASLWPVEAAGLCLSLRAGDKKLHRTPRRRRLEVLQSLDQLGAGLSVASHDMDIRGAGDLLGEEQSGHVREVGIELYQQMLEDAVAGHAPGRRRRRDGHRPMVARSINVGGLGADPGRLCRRPQCAHVALSPAGGARQAAHGHRRASPPR